MVNTIINATKTANSEGGVGVAIIVCIILCGIVFGLLCGVIAIAMALWNGCICDIFTSLPEIGFWQMWGVYLFCDILFKPATTNNN
jgi:hypothetical protein